MQAAPKEIRCLDIWPMSKLNRIMIRTYRNLHRAGAIAIQFPIRVVGSRVSFEYLSAVPQDWARQDIKTTAEQIRKSLEAERDKLEAQLQQLMEGGTLEQIQAVQAKYIAINEILEG
jgi:predicted HTH transcriptional regulator